MIYSTNSENNYGHNLPLYNNHLSNVSRWFINQLFTIYKCSLSKRFSSACVNILELVSSYVFNFLVLAFHILCKHRQKNREEQRHGSEEKYSAHFQKDFIQYGWTFWRLKISPLFLTKSLMFWHVLFFSAGCSLSLQAKHSLIDAKWPLVMWDLKCLSTAFSSAFVHGRLVWPLRTENKDAIIVSMTDNIFFIQSGYNQWLTMKIDSFVCHSQSKRQQ